MAAMVVGPNCRRLLNRTISRSWIGSQTTTRRIRWGQSLTAYEVIESAMGPLPRNILADELIRFTGAQAVKDCPHLMQRGESGSEGNFGDDFRLAGGVHYHE